MTVVIKTVKHLVVSTGFFHLAQLFWLWPKSYFGSNHHPSFKCCSRKENQFQTPLVLHCCFFSILIISFTVCRSVCVLFYFILFYFENANILTRLPSNLSPVPGLRFTVFPVVIHPGIGATICSFVLIIIRYIICFFYYFKRSVVHSSTNWYMHFSCIATPLLCFGAPLCFSYSIYCFWTQIKCID